MYSPRSVVILRGEAQVLSTGPHPALATYVSGLWALSFEEGHHTVRSLPDGCVDLTFDLAASPSVGYVSGPQTEPKSFTLVDRVAFLGARLFPGAASLLLGRSPDYKTLWSPLSDWIGEEANTLATSLLEAKDTIEALTLLEAYLAKKFLSKASDHRLSRAVEILFAERGACAIPELAKSVALSERTLSRLFTDHVGISPKRFARIVRFQYVLRRIGEAPDWAQVAADLGYYDQSHLIHEFKELFGCTPEEARLGRFETKL